MTRGAPHDDAGSGSHGRRQARPEAGCLSRRRDPLPTRVEDLPPAPASFEAALDAGLSALGLILTPDARRVITDHVRLLLAWNRAINLTAVRDPEDIARRHVLDSLAAIEPMRARTIEDFADIGSGGGFPALPLAAVLGTGQGLLIESVGKKARFLSTAVAALGLAERLQVLASRAESVAGLDDQRGRWPAVTARAVAGLADLIELGLPLLAPGGWLVAWKGGAVESELPAADRAAAGLGGASPEVVASAVPGASDHRLVLVRKIRPTPAGFPRDPAIRRRRPW